METAATTTLTTMEITTTAAATHTTSNDGYSDCDINDNCANEDDDKQ